MKTKIYSIICVICLLFSSSFVLSSCDSSDVIGIANAKGIGFDKTYIPSVHIGLYEKYGYTYIKDIVNYGGDIDSLYAKELR